MEPTAAWLIRDDPSYDPNWIGAVSQAKVVAALIEAGKSVLVPYMSVRPYDVVIEEAGRFLRVQCKTGRLLRGAIKFLAHRRRAAKRETGWERRVTRYEGAVDLFGVYCPDNGAVYLVPITHIPGQGVCYLRLTPAKNNQSRRIRWASDYLVVPREITRSPEATLLDVH